MMVSKTRYYIKAAHTGEGIPKILLEQIELCETPLQLFGPRKTGVSVRENLILISLWVNIIWLFLFWTVY